MDQSVERSEILETQINMEDLPEAIADLRDAFADSSKQSRLENQRFEERLNKALQFQTKSPSQLKSPYKRLLPPPVSLEDHLNVLQQTLEQSRREDSRFESCLKQALEE